MKRKALTREEMIRRIGKKIGGLSTDFDTPNPAHVDDMSAQLQRAYERLRDGKATDDDVHNLVDAVNVCLKLITEDRFPEALIHTKSAEAALILIHERRLQIGRWATKMPELDAIREFLPIHDAIVQNSAHIEIEKACEDVRKDLRKAA